MSNTKVCVCIGCGKGVTVTKFASPSKVQCDECKQKPLDIPVVSNNNQPVVVEDNSLMKTHKKHGRIDGEPNPALASLSCPYHSNNQMETVSVIKDKKWGDKLVMQCTICNVIVEIVDRSDNRAPILMDDSGVDYDEDTTRFLDRIEAYKQSDNIVGVSMADGNYQPVEPRRSEQQQMVLDAILAKIKNMNDK